MQKMQKPARSKGASTLVMQIPEDCGSLNSVLAPLLRAGFCKKLEQLLNRSML